jgi:hypothetical protein
LLSHGELNACALVGVVAAPLLVTTPTSTDDYGEWGMFVGDNTNKGVGFDFIMKLPLSGFR